MKPPTPPRSSTMTPASGWLPASAAPTIPGLVGGPAARAGPGWQRRTRGPRRREDARQRIRPVPPQFLTALREPPDTEVVDLLNTQAYRYSGLGVASSGLALTLYTIPTSATSTTAIVCYAQRRVLERSAGVRTARRHAHDRDDQPAGRSADLSVADPPAGLRTQISAIASRVNALLGTLRPQLRQGASTSHGRSRPPRAWPTDWPGRLPSLAACGRRRRPHAHRGRSRNPWRGRHEAYAALAASLSDEKSANTPRR